VHFNKEVYRANNVQSSFVERLSQRHPKFSRNSSFFFAVFADFHSLAFHCPGDIIQDYIHVVSFRDTWPFLQEGHRGSALDVGYRYARGAVFWIRRVFECAILGPDHVFGAIWPFGGFLERNPGDRLDFLCGVRSKQMICDDADHFVPGVAIGKGSYAATAKTNRDNQRDEVTHPYSSVDCTVRQASRDYRDNIAHVAARRALLLRS
jgi:hypothetical protein